MLEQKRIKVNNKQPKHASFYINAFIDQLPHDQKSKILIERTIKQVHQQFAQCVDPFILDHVNSIYLTKEEDVSRETIQRLTVYVDNSTIAAELNAQRELIILKYRELFSLEIDELVIKISRGAYLENHPFRSKGKKKEKISPRPLSDDEMTEIENCASLISDNEISSAFKNAHRATKEHFSES